MTLKYLIVTSLLLYSVCVSAEIVDITPLANKKYPSNYLTDECNRNDIAEAVLCAGNEGKAWVKYLGVDVRDDGTTVVDAKIGFQSRHKPFSWFTAYSWQNTGYVLMELDEECEVVRKSITFSSEGTRLIQFGLELLNILKLEDYLPTTIDLCPEM